MPMSVSVSGLPQAQIMGFLDWRDLAAVRQVCAEWRSLNAAWVALRIGPVRKVRQVLAMSVGPALRCFSADEYMSVEHLSLLATVAPRLKSLEIHMLPTELHKAQTTFLAFRALRRLSLDCRSTAALNFPESLSELCLREASPSMVPATLEALIVYGSLQQPDLLVRLCASASGTPFLRKLKLPLVSGADFTLLTDRLMQRDLLTLTLFVKFSKSKDKRRPLDAVAAFPFEDADREACLELIATATEATVTMRNDHGRLRVYVPYARLHATGSLRFLSALRIGRLFITGCTQGALDECLTLDVPAIRLHGEVRRDTAVTRIMVPRMDGRRARTLELYWFAEVRFALDFVPGNLDKILLDKPAALMPECVCRVEGERTVLHFAL